MPTKNIRLVGWFSDLPHGRSDEAPLRSGLNVIPEVDASAVADYLDGGTVIAETTGAVLCDEIAPDRPEIGPFRTQSDGEFVWPSDFPYYVRKYCVTVPEELIDKARVKGESPILAPEEIDQIVDALLN